MWASARVEVFFGKHGDGWRLYVHGWAPPYIRQKLDENGEAFPVAAPELADLDAFMFRLDAPYQKQLAGNGDVAIEARGRAVIALGEWLNGNLYDCSR
jgi:hypothetical protein